ncbi:MAG: hypothetical protein QXU88_01035 [Candidatus Woesearchaeota archaeon]
MQFVDISYKKIEVEQFDPRTEEVSFRVIVNSAGKEKAFVKRCKIIEPAILTKEVISEIRNKAKKADSGISFVEDEGPLAGTVVVRTSNDIEELEEKMTRFFSSICERARSAKLGRLSYYEIEKSIKGMSLVF